MSRNSHSGSIVCNQCRNFIPPIRCSAASNFLADSRFSHNLAHIRNVLGGSPMSLSRSLNALMIGAAFALITAVVLGILP